MAYPLSKVEDKYEQAVRQVYKRVKSVELYRKTAIIILSKILIQNIKHIMYYHKQIICSVFATLSLFGCTVLPASGPYSQSMKEKASLQQRRQIEVSDFRYALVDLSRPITRYLSTLNKTYPDSKGWPRDQSPQDIKIDVNDTVQVTIYESQSGGLFIPVEAGVRPGNFVSIPPQIVDKSGLIDVPFAGTISVVGRTPTAIGREISEKLGHRAIEPQTIVSITSRNGSEVSVVGEVANSSRFSLSLNGDKILDAIARAGGPTVPGYETWVSLQRGPYEWEIPFDLLVLDPTKNIYLHPKDTVYLYREPEMFQMFGASGFNGNYPFIKRSMSLAEAIGEARGLQDGRADPAEIYVYRHETRKNLNRMGLRLDFPENAKELKVKAPIIYRLNLREPDGFFLAKNFPIQDEDIVYIANSESVELTKFLDLLNLTADTKIEIQRAIEQ